MNILVKKIFFLIKRSFIQINAVIIINYTFLQFPGIKQAVDLAEKHIKANGTILPDIELKVVDNDDGCHLDRVMRTFINYYVRPDMILGVLGPPCSETVEPIASKQFAHLLRVVKICITLTRAYRSYVCITLFVGITFQVRGHEYSLFRNVSLCLQK